MIKPNFSITNDDVKNYFKKRGTQDPKISLSKQATIETAIGSRVPQNPGAPVPPLGTSDGFGRTS